MGLGKGQASRASSRRARILAFVEGCDHSPSIQEIADAVGLKSKATVHYHLRILQRDGLVGVSAGGRWYVRRSRGETPR